MIAHGLVQVHAVKHRRIIAGKELIVKGRAKQAAVLNGEGTHIAICRSVELCSVEAWRYSSRFWTDC
ncbi:MAG: hypothetical protein ACYCOR_19750, partial [Acidobacteriaceae bacterium]